MLARIVSFFLIGYALFVDLQALILYSSGDSTQAKLLIIWGILVSIFAIVEFFIVFGVTVKKSFKKLISRQKRS